MEKRNKIKQDNETEPPYKLVTTFEKITAKCSWLSFIKVLKALGLKQLADARFKVRGSNRGYRNGDILTAFLLMLNEGKGCLSNVGLLKNRTAVCCSGTNGVTLCRTLALVCRSDKLRLVLTRTKWQRNADPLLLIMEWK